MFNPCPKPKKTKKTDRQQWKQRRAFLDEMEIRLDGHAYCEVCALEKIPMKGCEVLDPAHRHERQDYFSDGHNGEILWDYNQVIIAGRAHHRKMDTDKAYREQVFMALRGNDKLNG